MNRLKAAYIGFDGQPIKNPINEIKTFIGNTYVDYCFGKEINSESIVIDSGRLVFTDHCAVIVEYSLQD